MKRYLHNLLIAVDQGGNDAAIQSTFATKLAELFADCPNCLVHVVGPYDGNAPSAPVAGFASLNTAISAACAGFKRVWFHNMQGVAFTKSGDAIHPDPAGHVTLFKDIYNRIAAVHGLHTVS